MELNIMTNDYHNYSGAEGVTVAEITTHHLIGLPVRIDLDHDQTIPATPRELHGLTGVVRTVHRYEAGGLKWYATTIAMDDDGADAVINARLLETLE
jgi:hypothetical protein